MEFAVTEDHEHAIGLGKRRKLGPRFDHFAYHLPVFFEENYDEPVVDDSIDDAAIEVESAGWLNPPAPGRFRG